MWESIVAGWYATSKQHACESLIAKLKSACTEVQYYGIVPECLGQAMAQLPTMRQQVFALKEVETHFMNLVDALSKLNVRPCCVNGEVKMYVPIIPTIQTLELQSNSECNSTGCDLCEEFGIGLPPESFIPSGVV
jgi:hypothetical protein